MYLLYPKEKWIRIQSDYAGGPLQATKRIVDNLPSIQNFDLITNDEFEV